MKKGLLFALPIVLGLATGCLKGDDETPIVQPQGTFTGKFTRLRNPRLVNSKQVWDTTLVNLNLELSGTTYKVTGDTTLHAGSKGTFNFNRNYIEYYDSTIPATNTTPIASLPKVHMAGLFQYEYDGSVLRFKAYNDTLVYFYDFKK